MNKKILTVTLNPCVDKTVETDGFTVGGLNRVVSVRSDFGGKGINVARVAKSFGLDVTACGIAAGASGEALARRLGEEEIAARFVGTDGEMRTNLKLFDSRSLLTTEVNESGAYVGEETLSAFCSALEDELKTASVLVLAGSVPKGVSDGIYRELTLLSARFSVPVILDADGERLAKGIEARPYAVKPNLFELEQLVGRKLKDVREIVLAAQALIEKHGIALAAVSLGGDGAVFVTREEAIKTSPFPIECKSTVGAGDSMVAVLACCLCQGASLTETAKAATAAGTLTASKEGTGLCRAKEILRRAPEVEASACL